MDAQQLKQRLDDQDKVLVQIAHDIKRIKQFFMWTFIATLVTFVLPLLAAAFVIPYFMNQYFSTFDGLL